MTTPERWRALLAAGRRRAHWLLALLFVALFFWLTARQYRTFDLVAPDADRFVQAIWNTLHGRFLYTTIVERSILSYHFSPALALLAPLLLLWEDPRILFLAQTIAVAAAGLILHRLVRRERPDLALWFLLAFYLNPSLHEVALHELRRVIFAMPFLALAVYGLHTRRYRLLAAGLLLALPWKEDIALIVVAAGAYLLIFRRDWRWGGALLALGLVWGIAVTFYLIPALGPGDSYEQMGYYGRWGSSPADLVAVFFRRPAEVFGWMFNMDGVRALLRVLIPLGLFLPFLSPGLLLLPAPLVLLALLSTHEPMHRLEDWYMAPILPLLFGALIAAALRLPPARGSRFARALLFSTLAGFLLFSRAPLGGAFNPDRYRVTAHHRVAAALVDAVPDDAAVAAQSPYLIHLAFRQELRLFPWVGAEDPVDYYLLDRHLNAYPLSNREMGFEIDNLLADPALVVREEGDGAYLLEAGGAPQPGTDVGATAEETMHLERVEFAVSGPGGLYQPIAETPVPLVPGQRLRVHLYWRALDRVPGERTVSVRLLAADGFLLAQHDMQPSSGARPTSWWEPGWHFRDIYTLDIPPGAAPGPATLAVTLYDSFTLEPVPFAAGDPLILAPAEIRPAP